MGIADLTGQQQWNKFEQVGTDTRPRVSTGWAELDAMLYRQSFGPSTFVVLGGRMHTRKTAVMANLVVNMLRQGVPVGLVGLDEAPHMYVAKLLSVIDGTRSHTELDLWGLPAMDNLRKLYLAETPLLRMTDGHRPTLDDLSQFLDVCEVGGARPRIVFVDYLALIARGKYDGKDTTRIPRLCEDLQVWTDQQEIVTVALHQVGRTDDTSKRYHGHKPGTPEQLMYGGEQQADIILQTYRPALDPVGNMTQEDAIAEGVDVAEWQARRDRAFATRDDTYLQLTKNRPGDRLHFQGLRLRSNGLSQKMEVIT